MKCDLRRGLDDSYINAGRDGGNNPKKPLTERWHHAWCHSSRKRFSSLVGVYQRYDFMPEMRDVILRREQHLLSFMDTPDDVSMPVSW
jgi:hypothetical protein